MILLPVHTIAFTQEETVRVFYRSFDGGTEEYAPTEPTQARATSKKLIASSQTATRVLSFFQPTQGPKEGLESIKFAFLCRGRWLYVDALGHARRERSRTSGSSMATNGRFDVVGFETFLRRNTTNGIGAAHSNLVSAALVNRTASTLTLIDASGRQAARVPANSSGRLLTWFVPQKAYLDGKLVANINFDYQGPVSESRTRLVKTEILDWLRTPKHPPFPTTWTCDIEFDRR